MDPLVELAPALWAAARDTFKSSPHCLPAYYAMDMLIRFPDICTTLGAKVYNVGGDSTDGVVITMDKGTRIELIILIKDNTSNKIEQALVESKRICKDKTICVPWAMPNVMGMMGRISHSMGLFKFVEGPSSLHYIDKESKPYADVRCPANTYTSALQLAHVDQIDEVWPHRYATSKSYFELLIRNNLSYGLFADDHRLLAWTLISEVGFLNHLFCLEEFRNKGYAEFLIKFVVNDQLKQGRDVFCYIVDGNDKSLNLFKKLHFKHVTNVSWLFFKSL
ncbi:uncharacterized protein LOC105395290 [Plutella xylostella]|uniref:uncharacterized protein LOC105395290 n=1 Tax=Plutella xylostella TaxID=51655 RepID=UPI00203256EA|nr:uncharacterized protein LOC105395290 [Plutella xylostella]